jgi:FecR-like protein
MRRASSLPALLLLSTAFVLCCSVANLAQNREKFVISAKAGGINAITGRATVYSRGNAEWQQLSITDDLNAGDRVRTDFDGRVEILLNPGSYLRVGGNSEVELLDNTLENLEVRLLRGTAIVEATGADGLELNISISTPHTKLAIVRQGLYRLSVIPGDATELIVRKGRVILSDSHTKVKGGNKVVFSANNVSVAKLTKEEKKVKDKEEVDVWSKERAETLAKANRRINDRMLNSAFASFIDNDPFSRSRLGFWFFNSHARCYTFLPFYYGWRSPYGNSYSNSVYYNPYYYPRPNVRIPGTGNTGYTHPGTSGSGGSTSGGGSTGGYRPPSSTPRSERPAGGFGNGGGYGNGGMRPQPSRGDGAERMPNRSRPINQ